MQQTHGVTTLSSPIANLANALRRGLHLFAKPWHRLRAVNVFLDGASMGGDRESARRHQRSFGKQPIFCASGLTRRGILKMGK